jgi:hypothetical protein
MSDLIITVLFTFLLAYLSYSCYQKYKESTQAVALVEPILLNPQTNNDVIEANSHPILQSIL